MNKNPSKVKSDEARSSAGGLRYMPQLDGLRALAVFAVWFEHWNIAGQRGFRCIEWGHLGVWLFFVLSGFLITDILIKARDDQDGAHHTTMDSARVFYIRRFLRILPAYFLTLFVSAAFLPEVRRLFIWHFTYTTDFWTALHPDSHPLGIHFWTLAIEEQFYLIWPWVILLTPRRMLVPAGIAVFVAGAGYRGLYQGEFIPHVTATKLLLPVVGILHTFAIGALLVLTRGQGGQDTAARRWICRLGLWAGLPMLVVMEVFVAGDHQSRVPLMFSSLAASLVFTWVIAGAAKGFGGIAGRLLQSPVLVYPGKISYGLYLFHPFVPGILRAIHFPLPKSVWVQFIIFGIFTLILASASWYLLERPINALKKRFPYARTGKKAAVEAGTELTELSVARTIMSDDRPPVFNA